MRARSASLTVEVTRTTWAFWHASQAFLFFFYYFHVTHYCVIASTMFSRSPTEIVRQGGPMARDAIVLPEKNNNDKQPLTTWKNISWKYVSSRWIKCETMATAPRDTIVWRRTTRAALYEGKSLGKLGTPKAFTHDAVPFLSLPFVCVCDHSRKSIELS